MEGCDALDQDGFIDGGLVQWSSFGVDPPNDECGVVLLAFD